MTALGLSARGHWSERKYLFFEWLLHYGVECLVIDDAHDLSMPHLICFKELTDQLQFTSPPSVLGLCLVAAGRGTAMPLTDGFEHPETMWLQFRRRLDRVQPDCRIASQTEGEVRHILLADVNGFSIPPFQNWIWVSGQGASTPGSLTRFSIHRRAVV